LIKQYFSEFITAWIILLVLNQAFIFGCFAPYCILAGMPHTGVIAFLYVMFLAKTNKGNTSFTPPIEDAINKLDKGMIDLSKTLDEGFKELDEITDKQLKELEAEEVINNAKRKVRKKEAQAEADRILASLNNLDTPPDLKSKNTQYKHTDPDIDPLKHKGDLYEKFIGKQFEAKGELVIYNGFINGYQDNGVDIICISTKTKTINLIQCKNWTKKPMMLEDVKNVYEKLQKFSLGWIPNSAMGIQAHLQFDRSIENIRYVLKANKSEYAIRRTLYVGSDKVIDLNIGTHVKLIKPTIFKYEKMKIVIKGLR